MKKVTILALHLGYGGAENAIISLANNICNDYLVEIVSVYKLYENPAYPIDSKVKITYLLDTDIALKVDEYKKAIHSFDLKRLFKSLLKEYKINIIRLLKDTIDSYITVKKKKSLLIDYLKNMKTDIVISTRIEYNYLVSEYVNDAYKIAWEHNHGDLNYIKEVSKSIYNMDKIVVVSNGLYDLYKKETDKVVCISNVIDELPTKLSKLDNKKLLSVGRLVTIKGYDDMIDVMNLVHDKDDKITLEIIGDGDQFYILRDKINKLKLNDVITLSGLHDKKYINERLADTSLFIMTSHSESFGIVVLEAMAAKVPTIAFDSAEGLNELISKDNGILIKDRNKEKMANEIVSLLNSPKRLSNLGENAYTTSLLYTKDKIKDKWLKLLENK